jgi:hypothetical protein
LVLNWADPFLSAFGGNESAGKPDAIHTLRATRKPIDLGAADHFQIQTQ